MSKENQPFHIVKIGENGANLDYFQDSETLSATAHTHLGRRFDNFEGDISVKSDFNRRDYEYFRTNTSDNSAIGQMITSQKAYEKVGMVRNIIDMMAEFTTQGVRVEHVHPKKQRFLQEWFEYVNGPFVSERLAHMLYRLGAAPIQTGYGTISLPNEKKMSMSQGQFGEVEYEPITTERRQIPLKYTFIPPWDIEIIGGDISLFIGKPLYAIKIPSALQRTIGNIGKIGDEKLRKALAETLNKLGGFIDKGGKFIYLDPDKFDIYFYKKDDWQVWPIPMIGAIIDDLMVFEKMRLADMAALDGAISNIRHWTVGIIDTSNPSNSIIPTKAGINKIRTILANSLGGGTMDLVTGPEIKFTESSTQVHQFLGSEKYETTLNAIYDGLGIPPPLRSSSSTNATNNYISLKTLVERLQYGRNIVISFWTKQLEIVQKALGHKIPGRIVFDNMVLSDEAAEKKILIELLDRDIIDPEAVQRYCGFTPSLVKSRLNKHVKDRENGGVPKAGPFHTAEKEFEHKKSLLQNGDVAPSELGIELKPRKTGEEPRIDKLGKQKAAQRKSSPTNKKKSGSKGRPKNITEVKKRKKKPNFRPQTGKASYHNLLLWANSAYNTISDKLSPVILSTLNKKNFRQLTVQESKEAEDFKFAVFSQLEPFTNITDAVIYAVLQTSKAKLPSISHKYDLLKRNFIESNSREPTTEENRQLFILAYVEEKTRDS
jgi:hypothetical protein